MIPDYAELVCQSNFTFLHGASHPEELLQRAAALGYTALAITDECSVAGVVRAHLAARDLARGARIAGPDDETPRAHAPPALIVGATFALEAEPWAWRVAVLAQTRDGYGRLSQAITTTRRRAPKGRYRIGRADFTPAAFEGCLAILVPQAPMPGDAIAETARWLAAAFPADAEGARAHLGCTWLLHGHDRGWLARLRAASAASGVPLAAVGDARMHVRSRKPLHDVLAAIRLGRPVAGCGTALASNAEQHLRPRVRLATLFPPELLAASVAIARRCRFSLDELRYEYPEEIVPEGQTPAGWLRALAEAGAAQRYPNGVPPAVRAQIEHELALIAELRYEPYFLTVADLVRFAREQRILCQGRGSAANSAVCYCLGITEVDPARTSVLFERFISRERNEPPDIDVDFEHQRREEVIQYLYRKYGRERAALTATVISYRARSALRDVGKVLGIDAQRIDRLARAHAWWDKAMDVERLREAGFDPESPTVAQWIELTRTLRGFPRHLSQHTGGFVIARDALTRLVPVENAAMADRTVIQWDKDDLDALGLLKVDVLALGMLSAVRRALEFIGTRRGTPFRMQDVPAEDPDTYEMIGRADTVGVFQIESRAQMSMLPRLRPRCFYDLVIEVAIVRPGPIQGGMVHPYLRRRQGLEPVVYPRAEIRPALERTLGVPIFQEQVMQIAILAAGFTPGEADALRRAMAAWKRKGGLGGFHERVIEGMLARGYDREFAESIFRQIEGFGEYGFPESHAASFALLVYVSCWIKRHEPAAFLAAMLDSQPLGFYAPAQLVRDARAHGVEVRGVDVLVSEAGCTLEEQPLDDALQDTTARAATPAMTAEDSGPTAGSARVEARAIDWRPQPAVRLGLAQVRGLSQAGIARLLEARDRRRAERGADAFAFDDVEDLARAAALDARDLQALAQADALAALAGHRAAAAWEVAAMRPMPALLADARFDEAPVVLAPPTEGAEIVADYAALGIPMGRHPLALLRPRLARFGVQPAAVLARHPHGRLARASGLVTHRQRPETARGTLFVTLEDETGTVNVIVWPDLFERQRAEVIGARLMTVYGTWQRDADTGGRVMHLLAQRVVDHTALLGGLAQAGLRSRDFR